MPKKISPAEPDARAEMARKALDERAAELNSSAAPHTPGSANAADGESPGQPGGVAPRDAEKDAAAFSALLEVGISGAARIVAWRFPATALFVGETVLPKVQGFAEHTGAQLGPAVGMVLPRALPALGGICSMLAWWMRSLPPPKVQPRVDEKPQFQEPAPPPAGAFQ